MYEGARFLYVLLTYPGVLPAYQIRSSTALSMWRYKSEYWNYPRLRSSIEIARRSIPCVPRAGKAKKYTGFDQSSKTFLIPYLRINTSDSCTFLDFLVSHFILISGRRDWVCLWLGESAPRREKTRVCVRWEQPWSIMEQPNGENDLLHSYVEHTISHPNASSLRYVQKIVGAELRQTDIITYGSLCPDSTVEASTTTVRK